MVSHALVPAGTVRILSGFAMLRTVPERWVYTARVQKCRTTCRQGDLPRLSAKKLSAGIQQRGKL